MLSVQYALALEGEGFTVIALSPGVGGSSHEFGIVLTLCAVGQDSTWRWRWSTSDCRRVFDCSVREYYQCDCGAEWQTALCQGSWMGTGEWARLVCRTGASVVVDQTTYNFMNAFSTFPLMTFQLNAINMHQTSHSPKPAKHSQPKPVSPFSATIDRCYCFQSPDPPDESRRVEGHVDI